MEITTFVSTLLFAAAAFWYAFESRLYRLQGAEQLELLRHQTLVSVAPTLMPSIVPKDELKKAIQNDRTLDDAERAARLSALEKSAIRYACSAENPSDKVAYLAQIFIYDQGTKSYLEADFSKDYVGPKESETFQVSDPYMDRGEIKDRVLAKYGSECEGLLLELAGEGSSFIALFFTDLESHVYMVKRPFEVRADGEIRQMASKQIFGA